MRYRSDRLRRQAAASQVFKSLAPFLALGQKVCCPGRRPRRWAPENRAVKSLGREGSMKRVKCPCCGAGMRRNGRTAAGARRWRCESCGASRTISYDDSAARLEELLAWLLSKATQADMPGRGRTFRRLAAGLWPIWPMPEPTGEVFRVLFLDGIWLDRDPVVPMAHDGGASSRGTWPSRRRAGRGRRSWRRSRPRAWWCATAARGSRRPSAGHGRARGFRGASSTRSAR